MPLGFGELMLLLLFICFAINVPVAFSFVFVSLIFVFLQDGLTLMSVAQKMISGMNSFVLLTVPFFIMVGLVMNRGGITKRIFSFARSLVGHIPGGFGHVNIVASMIFAGMSGAAQADAAGLGQVEVEGMVEEGYDKEFSAAIAGASATIGPVIPPSIVLVVYGALGGVSVGALLLGGLIPGIMMGLVLMLTVYIITRKRDYPVHPRASIKEIWVAFKGAIWAILAPIILIGGIFSGVFTATEAGAIAALYAIIVCAFVYRSIKLADIPQILSELVISNAGIMLIIGGASAMGWMFTWEGIPQAVARSVIDFSSYRWVTLLFINFILLVSGMLIEGLAILTVLVPILRPIATALDMDLVHFGVMVVLNLMIGTLTPPVGVVSYILCTVADISLWDFTKAVWPFLISLFVALLLVTFIPQLVLFLPNLAF